MNPRQIARQGCAIALIGALGACGVSAEAEPKTIAPADVPFGLAERGPVTPSSSAANGPFAYDLYFVSGDRLSLVSRSAKSAPTATATLRELARGPDRTETEEGLRTILPPDVSVERVTVDDGLATVSLDGDSASSIGTDEQALGIAQLVYTMTALPDVDRVRFEVGGTSTEVPRGDGSLSRRPVTRADYPDAAP